MDDCQMETVTAQAGITIWMDTAVQYNVGSLRVSDTDSDPADWIELQGFSITNGTDDYFSVKTPWDDPVTIDVATDANGHTMLVNQFSTHTEPRYYRADVIVFCAQPIGSLDLDNVILQPSTLRLGAPVDGSNSALWDLSTQIDVDHLAYTYNNVGDTFSINGVHLAGTADGDPADPSTWVFDGQFTIGDFDNDTPAAFDVGTDPSTGITVVSMLLPMQGTIRIEEIDLGAQSFGPAAIDGLQIHRFSVGLFP